MQQALPEAAIESTNDQIPRRWIDELFARFSRIWGPLFTDRFPNEDEEKAWANIWGVGLVGMTSEQIGTALARMTSESKFPPGSPAEFREYSMLSADTLGVPDLLQTLALVCALNHNRDESYQDRYMHPMVFALVRDDRIDSFNLSRARTSIAQRRLEPIYDEYVRRVAAGEQFEFPTNAELPDYTGQVVTPEERARGEAARDETMRRFQEMRNQGPPDAAATNQGDS